MVQTGHLSYSLITEQWLAKLHFSLNQKTPNMTGATLPLYLSL